MEQNNQGIWVIFSHLFEKSILIREENRITTIISLQ